MLRLTQSALAALIDHTLLKPDAKQEEIEKLCLEAAQFNFASVCVEPYRVAQAAQHLKDTPVKVGTVIGFPLGANRMEIKTLETVRALADGAHEIDVVINIGAARDGNWRLIADELTNVRKAARDRVMKVILETCFLTRQEIIEGCKICEDAGADFVKTSTGFGPDGATTEWVSLMRKSVSERIGVKASGGVRDLATLMKMVDAGATRIGTSSGVHIMNQAVQEGLHR